MTRAGGTQGDGTVYELARSGGDWQYKVLYNFCVSGDPSCPDGALPTGGLIADTDGNLYGTTSGGGGEGFSGTAFKLTPNADGSHWKLKTLQAFSIDGSIGPEGALGYDGAAAGLPYDGSSPLYGTLCCSTGGAVFSLTPRGKRWTSKILHEFGGSEDGSTPSNGVLVQSDNLFGTTPHGGVGQTSGTVFRVTKAGQAWTENVLYSFCSQPSCIDGQTPDGPLAVDDQGTLYGTTYRGGKYCPKGKHSKRCLGTIFKLAPDGSTYSVLYSFCPKKTDRVCLDGAGPAGGVVVDSSRNLFGATGYGGTNDGGTVFELTSGGSFTTLYSFCSQTDCADGKLPSANLILDAAGDLFGTTSFGGETGHGTVFALTP